jgi:hypothetical protein
MMPSSLTAKEKMTFSLNSGRVLPEDYGCGAE